MVKEGLRLLLTLPCVPCVKIKDTNDVLPVKAKTDGACPPNFEVRFKLGIFPNEVWVGVPKIPAKILIFEQRLKGTFQLSVEHLIFDLEFVGVRRCAVVCKPCSLPRIGDVARTKSKYISTASLQ